MSAPKSARDWLTELVAFDTTSRHSNLALIDHVQAYLSGLGARCERVPNADGSKANLHAVIGPNVDGGVVLSGHTDVVPVDGQAWSSDPWVLTGREGRLYGRGSCDMKGFIACALAAAPDFARASLKRPVHFALSHDEEVGCLGAPAMIARIAASQPPSSSACVMHETAVEAQTERKRQDKSACLAERRCRRAKTRSLRGPSRPVPAACATARTARG